MNDYLIPYGDGECSKVFTNEVFYVHLLAHMARHIVSGGCGVRAFLDIWLINQKWQFDYDKLNQILTKNNLLLLDNAVKTLSKVWFEDEAHNDATKLLEEYVLYGGIYGNFENQIAVSKAKSDGKESGLFKKIFLPYEQIKYVYPILQKHKWLTPFFEVVRWFRLVFKGRIKILTKQINANKTVTQQQTEKTAELLKQLGL